MIPTPPKPRSSKSDSDSISDPNESAFIFVEIMGGSLPLSDVLDLKKREKSKRFGFSMMEESMVAHHSHQDPTWRSGAWATSTSRASATTTTAKVTHWNPTESAWPTTCSNSVSPPPASLSVLPSSSTVATPISLSTGPVGSIHHAKKSEAFGFCYVNDIVLGFAKIQWIFEFIFIFVRIYFEVIEIIL